MCYGQLIRMNFLVNLLQGFKSTTKEGLSPNKVARQLGIFGPKKLESKDVNPFLLFFSFMWNPLSWVMQGAAIGLSNSQGKPPDWQDFLGIVLLLFIVRAFLPATLS